MNSAYTHPTKPTSRPSQGEGRCIVKPEQQFGPAYAQTLAHLAHLGVQNGVSAWFLLFETA